MSERIRVRYAPSPTGYLHLVMQELHYLIIYLLSIMMVIS